MLAVSYAKKLRFGPGGKSQKMATLLSNALFKTVRMKGGFLSVLQVNSCLINNVQTVRNMSFYNKRSKDEVWDSMTTVSSIGRKRGRASKGRLMKKFNIYQGKFFSPLEASGQLQEKAHAESETQKKIYVARKEERVQLRGRKRGIPPLDRGYSGRDSAGRRAGVPKSEDGYDYAEKGFQSVCLQVKFVSRMSAVQKNIDRIRALVVLGNGNGLAGYGIGKATKLSGAVPIARRRATQKQIYFDLLNGRTLYHNFYEEYHKTKVFAFRKHEGYGLVCHRVIKSICEVIGIKDIYVKVEGETKNYLAVTTAFFNGLAKMKSHQDMANETGQNVVIYDPALGYFPTVVASPSTSFTPTVDLHKDVDFDYENYFFDGRMYHERPVKVRKDRYGYLKRFKAYRMRNQPHAKMLRIAYGLEKDMA